MGRWEINLSIESRGHNDPRPLFVQVAQALVDDIRRGRLRPGDPLPGSRSLAQSLKVHRNTVLAAYNELEAEGWVTTVQARGTFVSDELPDPKPRPFAMETKSAIAPRVGYALSSGPELNEREIAEAIHRMARALDETK